MYNHGVIGDSRWPKYHPNTTQMSLVTYSFSKEKDGKLSFVLILENSIIEPWKTHTVFLELSMF